VFSEKSLALSISEGEQAIATCERAGVKLDIGYMMRFHPLHQKLRAMIENGDLGRIVLARAQLSCWYPPIPGAWRQNPAVLEVLRSGKVDYWAGKKGMEFEEKFTKWCGTEFAVSTSSGTSALHTVLAALGIGPGDEVITVPYTFIASSFSVLQAGLIPVFADVRKITVSIPPISRRRSQNVPGRSSRPISTARFAGWTRFSGSRRSTTCSLWRMPRRPTALYFGAQPGNERFFEKLGSTKGFAPYARQ
jgi:hypothetical protein